MRRYIGAIQRFALLVVLAGLIGGAGPDRFPRHATATTAAPAVAVAPAASGGRVEHCALSLGVVLGAGLSFWSNPFGSIRFLELGLMMMAVYC